MTPSHFAITSPPLLLRVLVLFMPSIPFVRMCVCHMFIKLLTYLLTLQLDEGKADTSVTIEELVAMLPSNSRYENAWSDLEYRVIVVAANVTEAATGTTLSGNNTVRCTSTKYVLSFLDITPTSFKPGLSVSAYVRTAERWKILLRMTCGN